MPEEQTHPFTHSGERWYQIAIEASKIPWEEDKGESLAIFILRELGSVNSHRTCAVTLHVPAAMKEDVERLAQLTIISMIEGYPATN